MPCRLRGPARRCPWPRGSFQQAQNQLEIVVGLANHREFDLERTIGQWVEAAEVRVVGDRIDVREDRLELRVELVLGLTPEASRRRLHGERPGFGEQGGDFTQSALCDLREGDSVLGIELGASEARNAGSQFFGHGQSGRIVGCAIDPEPRSEARAGLGDCTFGAPQ